MKYGAKLLGFLIWIVFVSQGVDGQATRIMGEGSDVGKILIGVIGDGYDSKDISNEFFSSDVQQLITEGLFEDDVFREYKSAFSVYRLDVASKESGISTPENSRETALKLVFTGNWESCWIKETPGITDANIKKYFGAQFYDYVVVIVNNGDNRGGCHPGGNRLYVTNRVSPTLIAHEFGHALANLFDEYAAPNFIEHPSSEIVNFNNCSNVVTRSLLSWKSELTPQIGMPTLTIPDGIDPATAVGMFEGCNYATKGLYRPMWDCRMKSAHDTVPFCKVCRRVMKNAFKNLELVSQPPIQSDIKGYLKLEVRLDGRDSEILRSRQIESDNGWVPRLTPNGDYVFRFTGDGKTISVGSLAQDPFVVRAFSDQQNNRGELLTQKESATIILNVPITDAFENTKENLKLELFKVDLEKLTFENDLLDLDETKLNKLKKDDLLKKRFELTKRDFSLVIVSSPSRE